MKKICRFIKTLPLWLVAFLIGISFAVPANADIFYFSWEYNSVYNEKVALELELKSLKKQFKNERLSLESKIRELEDNIERLNNEIELLKKGREEDSKIFQKRIAELRKVRDILKKKGSDREKKLIEENKRIQRECQKSIDELRKNYEQEQESSIDQLAKLKEDCNKRIEDLNTRISNLNDELSNIKKLSQAQKQELERMKSQADELEKQLASEIEKGDIRLKRTHEKIIINLDDRICFDSGRAILKNDVLAALEKIAGILSKYPENNIIVEGHTDNVPISTRQYRDNWQLSTARSLAVLRYLLKNSNLSPERLTAAGFGEYHPIMSNDTPENRALNRRVDIVVVPRVLPKK